MFRVLAIAIVLFATVIAFGGTGQSPIDVTENVAAECGQVQLGDDPCPPSVGCIVAGAVARATGLEPHCTM